MHHEKFEEAPESDKTRNDKIVFPHGMKTYNSSTITTAP